MTFFALELRRQAAQSGLVLVGRRAERELLAELLGQTLPKPNCLLLIDGTIVTEQGQRGP